MNYQQYIFNSSVGILTGTWLNLILTINNTSSKIKNKKY